MGMNKFDFLSSAPQNFIFNNNSNKTNFGGVLSLIYLIIVLIIAAYYLVFYINEDDYSIEYVKYNDLVSSFQKDLDEKKNDLRYNPTFTFGISLLVNLQEPNKRFIIKDLSQDGYPTIENFNSYKKRITEVDYIILYNCSNDKTCKNINKYNKGNVSFIILYQGFSLDHQNKTSPFYKSDLFSPIHCFFSFGLFGTCVFKWRIIKYSEEKGFFSIFDVLREKDEDYGKIIGPVASESQTTADYYEDDEDFLEEDKIDNETIHYYKKMGHIYFDLTLDHHDEYKRKAKSLLDAIANICSLSMTVLSGFSFVFVNYYSNNFDNYKIIEKILLNSNSNTEKKVKKEVKEEIELTNDFNKTDKEDNLIDKSNEDKNEIIASEDIDKIEYEDNKEFIEINQDKDYKNNNNRYLPKLRFIDFLFNNLYIEKFCKLNQQKIIEQCNEIISKYYSIELILYNQIKFENLLKDYKWNDPGLNNFDNNELIIQLKNFISSYKIK